MPINFIEPAKELEPVTLVNHEFGQSEYDEFVFSLEPGTVFYYDPKYISLNDVLAAIEKYKATHVVPEDYTYDFTVKVVLPGDIHYSVHGACALVVMSNEAIAPPPPPSE